MDHGMNATDTADGALDRREAVRKLLSDRGDLLIVSGLGSPSYDVYAAGEHDANFYLWGAMGSAALVALGIALAQPARPVAAVTGDGEQLMGLGGLATIAVRKPANLTVVVLDNGHFGETGMQLSHTGFGVDLHRIAAAAGFASSVDIRDAQGLEALSREWRKSTGGPRFATVRIAACEVQRALPPRDGVFIKHRFRRHLGLAI